MRILHTSDWHLGRAFGPVPLADDQQAFLDWLVELTAAESVDLVLVAGDVFDRAVAPTEAIALFRATMHRLLGAGAKVAVITGNHDGFDRVAAYGDLLDRSGLYVRGGYATVGEVLTLPFADGPLDVVLLPFLDPQLAPPSFPGGATVSGATVSGEGVGGGVAEARARLTHQSVLRAAVAACGPQRRSPRSVAVAHAFVTGGLVSDSERGLVVGGSGTVESALFAGFSYAALGHLHRPQVVAGDPTIRYSGAPLAYSFSETHQKSVTLVELDAVGRAHPCEVPVPVGRGVRTLTGTIADLLGRDVEVGVTECFVRAVLTDAGVVLDAKRRLTERFPHVTEIVLRPPRSEPSANSRAAPAARWTPLEAVDAFWVASTDSAPRPGERELLGAAVTAAAASLAEAGELVS